MKGLRDWRSWGPTEWIAVGALVASGIWAAVSFYFDTKEVVYEDVPAQQAEIQKLDGRTRALEDFRIRNEVEFEEAYQAKQREREILQRKAAEYDRLVGIGAPRETPE